MLSERGYVSPGKPKDRLVQRNVKSPAFQTYRGFRPMSNLQELEIKMLGQQADVDQMETVRSLLLQSPDPGQFKRFLKLSKRGIR